MHSSLARHVKLSHRSAAAYMGVTLGELYKLFDNNPPELLNLYELNAIEVKKLKNNERTSHWFNSVAAQHDPVLAITVDGLLNIIDISSDYTVIYQDDIWERFCQDFRQNLPHQMTIGGILEPLRLLQKQYQKLTGPLFVFIERLSRHGFFELI